jgi:hypothetical protein
VLPHKEPDEPETEEGDDGDVFARAAAVRGRAKRRLRGFYTHRWINLAAASTKRIIEYTELALEATTFGDGYLATSLGS